MTTGNQVDMLTPAQQQQLLAAFQTRMPVVRCSSCGNPSLALQPGITHIFLSPPGPNINIGGPSIPVAITVCERCGNVQQYALGALGLNNEAFMGSASG